MKQLKCVFIMTESLKKKWDTFKISQDGRIWNNLEIIWKPHVGKFQSPERNLQFQRHYKWTQYDFSEETWELDLQSKSDALLRINITGKHTNWLDLTQVTFQHCIVLNI